MSDPEYPCDGWSDLEPSASGAVCDTDDQRLMLSIAVSLKRLADKYMQQSCSQADLLSDQMRSSDYVFGICDRLARAHQDNRIVDRKAERSQFRAVLAAKGIDPNLFTEGLRK